MSIFNNMNTVPPWNGMILLGSGRTVPHPTSPDAMRSEADPRMHAHPNRGVCVAKNVVLEADGHDELDKVGHVALREALVHQRRKSPGSGVDVEGHSQPAGPPVTEAA